MNATIESSDICNRINPKKSIAAAFAETKEIHCGRAESHVDRQDAAFRCADKQGASQ
jgi:hypothetical protein